MHIATLLLQLAGMLQQGLAWTRVPKKHEGMWNAVGVVGTCGMPLRMGVLELDASAFMGACVGGVFAFLRLVRQAWSFGVVCRSLLILMFVQVQVGLRFVKLPMGGSMESLFHATGLKRSVWNNLMKLGAPLLL